MQQIGYLQVIFILQPLLALDAKTLGKGYSTLIQYHAHQIIVIGGLKMSKKLPALKILF